MFERGKKKTEFIGAKLTPEEYYYISSFAEENNMTISTLIIYSIAEYMARKIVEQEKEKEEQDGTK